ncbi:MAG: FUSC family protein [Pseudomonadota bacterium]
MAALQALDPGGIQLARGVHFFVVSVAGGGVCYFAGGWLGAPNSLIFAVMGGAVALNAFIFTPPGTRWSEAIAFAKNVIVAVAVFGTGVFVGWHEIGFGEVPIDSVWVLIIAFGLYLRRYGPIATQYGLMLTLMFMFMTLVNPTREEALWLVLAALLSGTVGMLVQHTLWRPSALAVLKREIVRFQRAIAAEVNACRSSDSNLPPHWAKRAWDMLSRACERSLAENPDERPRLQHINATGLRSLMALKVVTEAVENSHDDPPGSKTEQRDFKRMYADATALLMSPTGPGPERAEVFAKDAQATRDDLIGDTDLPRIEKFHWVRQVVGLSRLVRSAAAMRKAAAAIGQPWQEAVQRPAGGASSKQDAASMGWRLAIQGALAAGITVAVGLIFQLDHAYWATMTVFIVLSASLGATIKRTIERAVGTAAGVMIAIGLQPAIGDSITVQIVLVGLASIPIFVLIERHYMITAGLIGFVVVLALHLIEGVGLAGMEARLYQTAMGATLAVLASWLVFPIHAKDHVRPVVKKLLADCDAAVASVKAGDEVAKVSLAQLNGDSQALSGELIGLNSERFILRHHSLDSYQLQAHADSVVGYASLFIGSVRALQSFTLPERIRDLEDKLAEQVRNQLRTDIDSNQNIEQVDELLRSWQTTVPLDGSVPAREAVLVVEEYYYARKLIETTAGLRRAIAGLRV